MKKYRIEIWIYHNLKESFESNSIKRCNKWIDENWLLTSQEGNCFIQVMKLDKQEYKIINFTDEGKKFVTI